MQQNVEQQNVQGRAQGGGGCLSAGGVLAIFFVVGAGIAYWGWTVLQNARASASWPTAEGVVVHSDVRHTSDADGDDSYSPEVTYRYSIGEQFYEGSTIKFGENSYGSSRQADAIIANYPLGQRVAVYYDPAQPSRAVLEPGVTLGSYLGLCLGGLFILIAVVTAPLRLLIRSRP